MKSKKVHSDQQYVAALVANDSIIINEIYTKFAPKVIGYVCKNSGDEAAARDIIQETLITIYDQAKTNGLQLTCPFDAYFFLICKRKWLNSIKKSGNKEVTIEEERLYISDDADEQAAKTQQFEEQQNLYLAVLSTMGETCKKIITLGFSAMSMQEVADQMDVTYAYARKKKSLCISKLTQLIKESALYRKLKKDYY
ncbi:RNA polymerase sigma factor, sigma-70 family [Aequorivita sublithincola DSM 14238]|uniref:RNA polymerase sigma factor, sigma-70 family n=1 Tax=Aequorivita sublithincola (strain DSM 14238 / LMG 21431 / ACAM 643 / 9-3) TaxID=746697 RepID=I3YU74_AEQSU|nr:sigma-70 family RNA polymerase sigma factor [Aequorivita sublithincola]AFL80542.1 RNA polymerase sigma factor, sigma-70 family [Aequorivita sublithincola DSM 14238]